MLAPLSAGPGTVPSALFHIAHPVPLTQAVDADALSRGQVHHLPLEREVVSLLGTAHHPLPWGAHHFDSEVVQLEGVVRLCRTPSARI